MKQQVVYVVYKVDMGDEFLGGVEVFTDPVKAKEYAKKRGWYIWERLLDKPYIPTEEREVKTL